MARIGNAGRVRGLQGMRNNLDVQCASRGTVVPVADGALGCGVTRMYVDRRFVRWSLEIRIPFRTRPKFSIKSPYRLPPARRSARAF